MASGPATRAELQSLAAEVVRCRRCPRLVAFREQVASEKRPAYRREEYWGRPITGFGDPSARIVIVGLAPGAHGANRTGRIFTGDRSGQFLMAALHRAGFASQPTSDHAGDGLFLRDVYLTAAARCAPPGDRPTPRELRECHPFLEREMAALPELRVAIALGRVAFDSLLRYAGQRPRRAPRPRFAPGAAYPLGEGLPLLLCSYHPSPRNTNTGRLGSGDMVDLLDRARRLGGLDRTGGPPPPG